MACNISANHYLRRYLVTWLSLVTAQELPVTLGLSRILVPVRCLMKHHHMHELPALLTIKAWATVTTVSVACIMLLYLFALSRNGEALFGDQQLVPAGVLYVPARTALVDGNRNTDPQDVAQE